MEELQIDMTALLEEAREQLKNAAVESVKQQVKWTVERQLTESLGPIVKEFVAKEIAPALREQLIGEKSAIIEATVKQVPQLAQAVAEAVITTMSKNLGSSYYSGKVIEALMGK